MTTTKSQRSIIRQLAVLATIVGCVSCATFYTRPKEHPDHPGMCFWPLAPAIALSPGERKTIENCVQLTCHPNFAMAGTTCPSTPSYSPDQLDCVEFQGDETLEYPACCPQVKCVRKVDSNQIN